MRYIVMLKRPFGRKRYVIDATGEIHRPNAFYTEADVAVSPNMLPTTVDRAVQYRDNHKEFRGTEIIVKTVS